MKKAVIGGLIAIIGTMGNLAVFIVAALNMVGGWSTPPGRFLSTVSATGMTALMIFSSLFIALGLIIMGIEYFKKEGK